MRSLLALHFSICCDCCRAADSIYSEDITLAREVASAQGWEQHAHWTLCGECSGRPASYCDDCREGRGIMATMLTDLDKEAES